MQATREKKENTYLFSDMQFARDIDFIKAEKINLDPMTNDLK